MGIGFRLGFDTVADAIAALAGTSSPGVIPVTGVTTGGTPLSGLPSATLADGILAWVPTVGAFFRLTAASALTTDAITVVNASGSAGRQWIRLNAHNRTWEARTTWFVDPQNSSATASDENSGLTNVLQLRTYAELARRLFGSRLSVAVTVTASSNLVAGDTPSFWTSAAPGGSLTIVGTPTVIYTGVVTLFTAEAATAANDDNQLNDVTVPVSYTASGMLADGVLFTRTNGAALYWYGAKDLGAKTLRTSAPCDINGTVTPLVALDTYTASTLPTIGSLRFPLMPNASVTLRFLNYVDSAAGSPLGSYPFLSHSWKTAGLQTTIGSWVNPAFNSTQTSFVGRQGAAIGITIGMFRGAGATVAAFSGGGWALNRLTCQGMTLRFQDGAIAQLGSRHSAHDTSVCSLLSSTNSNIDFNSGGCIGGTGNSSQLLGTEKNGHFGLSVGMSGAVAVAASTSAGNPIQIGGTTYTIAALPAIPFEARAGVWFP